MMARLLLHILIPCSFPHADVDCQKPCERVRECGHPCLALCYQDCRCICSKDPPRSIERPSPEDHPEDLNVRPAFQVGIHKEPQVASRHGSPFSQLSDKEVANQIEAFQAFAKGGHIEADKKLVEDARKEAAKEAVTTVDEDSQQKLKPANVGMAADIFQDLSLLDIENESAPKKPDESPKKKTDGMELVRTTSGGRGVWKGTYDPMGGSDATEDDKKKTQGVEKSLLD